MRRARYWIAAFGSVVVLLVGFDLVNGVQKSQPRPSPEMERLYRQAGGDPQRFKQLMMERMAKERAPAQKPLKKVPRELAGTMRRIWKRTNGDLTQATPEERAFLDRYVREGYEAPVTRAERTAPGKQ